MTTQLDEPSAVPWDTSLGNRFSRYSSEDHSAPLWIAALLSFTYVLGMLLVRVFLKWRVFGWDDFLMVASTIICSIQSILIFNALRAGLGKVPAQAADIVLAGNLVFSSRTLILSSLYLAKLSVLFLLRRIFVRDQKRNAMLCNAVIVLTASGWLVSMMISSIRCPASKFFARHCHAQITKWTAVTAIDMSTEVVAFCLPPYMVWQLQMSVGTKLRVIAAFCFRLIVVVLSAAHLKVWISYTKGSPSPIAIVPALVWQQALIATSLITATIPNLKAFLQALSANWGGGEWDHTSKTYENGTFEMQALSSTARTKFRKGKAKNQSGFETRITTTARTVGQRSSLGSSESQDLIIRKQTVFTVERT